MKFRCHQPLLFAAGGLVGFLVDVSVLYVATSTGLGYFAGRGVSFLCATWATWQINRRFTFTSDGPQPAWKEWCTYLIAMSAGGAVNYGAYSVAVSHLPESTFRPLTAVAIGSAAGMILNYTTARTWVFSSR